MRIKVNVCTNSKRQKILKIDNGFFKIYTNQKPINGKANEEVIKIIAEYFGAKPNEVFIVSGEKSKEKIIELEFSSKIKHGH